jgi:RNA polymerase subunit RPABC4/transcription elongation factor Spt4
MKCPNCGEILKNDAKVCFTCGEDISKNQIDMLIDDMIKEDDANTKKNSMAKSSNTTKSSNSGTKPVKKANQDSTDQEPKKPEFGKAVVIIGYVNAIVVAVLLLTMLFSWFALGGRGTFKGFVLDQNSSQFMTAETLRMTREQIESLSPETEIISFSAKDLVEYGKLYTETYQSMTNTKGELKKSWAIMVQLLYIKGFYVIGIISLLSIFMLIIDKKLKAIEWTRGFSVLTIVIIGLNYAALKIPFFSMFAIRAKNALRMDNLLSAVTLNMNGINVNSDFYPYNIMEKSGFYIAVGACVIWFILSTVLVEMKKDKEYS